MKLNKKKITSQRGIIEKRLRSWKDVSSMEKLETGWIKVVRVSLGVTTRMLAQRLGVSHPSIAQLEKREAEGRASLESIQKVAQAMECQLVYAIIPKNKKYEDILNDRAYKAAKRIVEIVGHNMKLEGQGISRKKTQKLIKEQAHQLKKNLSPLLWDEF